MIESLTQRRPLRESLKAVGGGWSGVIFACEAYIKVPNAAESMLFKEWRCLVAREKYCNLNFQGPYFPTVKFHEKWLWKFAL